MSLAGLLVAGVNVKGDGMTTYIFFGGDMADANRYSPHGLPGEGDDVQVASGADGTLGGASLIFDGLINNDASIAIVAGGSLTLQIYEDDAATAIEDGGILTVKSGYIARNVLIEGVGSQLIVENGSLTVAGNSTLGTSGLSVIDGASEKWAKVVLSNPSAPLRINQS